MDRATAKLIKEEIELAMEKIAKKHKMSLETSNGSFSTTDFTCRVKLVGSVTTTTSKKKPAMGTTKHPHAVLLGLPENVVGLSFKHKTKTFTVVGLKPSRPKNAVELKDQNNKPFKCSAAALKNMAGLN